MAIVFAVGLACCYWWLMFSPHSPLTVSFWLAMACAAGSLALLGIWHSRASLRELFGFRLAYIPIGVVSAGLLYGVFYLGYLAATAMFGFAAPQVEGIYSPRHEESPLVIGLLLLFIIAPAEEIFWRGYVQHQLAKRYTPLLGFLLATAVYALVHIWSFNLMLFLAAGLCGLFWGAMYWRFRSVWPGLISHALWDVAIFVLWPLG